VDLCRDALPNFEVKRKGKGALSDEFASLWVRMNGWLFVSIHDGFDCVIT
jgi:hypothetical protein